MERKIEITIDPMGNPKVEAVGFGGVGCEAATAGIEAALGGAIDQRNMKPEYYNEGDTQTENHQTW